MTHTRLAHSGQETPKLTLTLYLNEGGYCVRKQEPRLSDKIDQIDIKPDDRLFELTELRFAVLAFGFW
ncbi:FAD synthase [Trichinella pseudospiralis]